MDKHIRLLASIGLAVGAIFGMAGVFAPSAALRGLAWGIDGTALVMAGALLTVGFYRSGLDLVASGFLVFTVGEGLILSTAAMDLRDGVPMFGAGVALWATALVLIGAPPVFPLAVRIMGFIAAALFGITALQVFAGVVITPTSTPLPFYAYPALVGTMAGWIWGLVRPGDRQGVPV
jgi:hypothetical protein